MSDQDDKKRDLVIHKVENGRLDGQIVICANGWRYAVGIPGSYESMHALAAAARMRGATHFGGMKLTDEFVNALGRRPCPNGEMSPAVDAEGEARDKLAKVFDAIASRPHGRGGEGPEDSFHAG